MTHQPHWNHNVHYHSVLLAAVPEGCGRALDVGCGDGVLTRELAHVCCADSPAPKVWPPPRTYREIESLVRRVLPGARFRPHLLWRWSVVWTKPNRRPQVAPKTSALPSRCCRP